jgi:aminomethyltransferase
VELGAKMVPFAGYDMPVQYPAGILTEHLHARAAAGLFDVSHMGQFRITGAGYDGAAASVEKLCPNDFRSLKDGQQRYGFLTNERGGILDDLMVTRDGDDLRMVVNAACKDADLAHLKANGVTVQPQPDFALLALQGPKAASVMARLAPDSAKMSFMTGAVLTVAGIRCYATRSGYTGEDGFEISVPNAQAAAFARRLLQESEVKPIGLGARDSLRLEAGLCLYGSDITERTSPVEAGLSWAIGERRRKEGGYPGATVLQKQWADGVTRKRVGILPEGKAPARAHTEIADDEGHDIGEVTSGGFGPSLGKPIAMGYVATASAAIGT